VPLPLAASPHAGPDMRQWDTVLVPYPTANNPHYLVLLSPDNLTGNSDFKNLNGLVCSTIRPPDRPIRSHEVFLDPADGFENKTACRCHLIIEFAREDILQMYGRVSAARQTAIKRKLREIFGL
jgi:hypothetical protein